MKTKQQLEEKLYKSYFIDRKKHRVLSNGIGLIFLIAIIMIITGFINGNPIFLENTFRAVGIMFFIYFLAVPLYFYLRYSYGKEINLIEEKNKLNKQIKESEEGISELQYKFNEKFENKNLNNLSTNGIICHMQDKEKEEKKINELQVKIWKLEFNLKMIGGTNQKNKQ